MDSVPARLRPMGESRRRCSVSVIPMELPVCRQHLWNIDHGFRRCLISAVGLGYGSRSGGKTPAEAYRGDPPADMMDKPLHALPTYPQAQQRRQEDRSKEILAR